MKFLDSNTLDPRTALVLSVISSDTDTDGEVIDTQGVRDINIVTTIQTLVAGDIAFQIRTADNSGMSTNLETIAASKINGNLYDSVILNAALAAGQKYHHHILHNPLLHQDLLQHQKNLILHYNLSHSNQLNHQIQ